MITTFLPISVRWKNGTGSYYYPVLTGKHLRKICHWLLTITTMRIILRKFYLRNMHKLDNQSNFFQPIIQGVRSIPKPDGPKRLQ